MGGALAKGSNQNDPVTRIPVGLASYPIPQTIKAYDVLSTSGSLTSMNSAGSIFSSYALRTPSSKRQVNISDMEVRPLGRQIQKPAGTEIVSKNVSKNLKPKTYSLEWQVNQPILSMRPTSLFRKVPSIRTGSHIIKPSKNLAQAVLRQIQSTKQGKFTLITYEHDSKFTISKQEDDQAQAVGLIRVAAQEIQQLAFHHEIHDAINSRQSEISSSDAFGVLSRQGAAQKPILLTNPESNDFAFKNDSGSAKGALVTGGFGDIGNLIGNWLQAQSGIEHIFLVGRSGRGSGKTFSSQDGCLVSGCMCDASASSDMKGLTDMIREQVAFCIIILMHRKSPSCMCSAIMEEPAFLLHGFS